MAKYYFAYGSNLSFKQMHTRCPDAQGVVSVVAVGWRLAFFGEGTKRWGQGGVASLVKDSSAKVGGALYLLSEDDELTLDGFEGVGKSVYFKDEGFAKHISCPQILGTDTVYAYLMSNHDTPNPPNVSYLEVVRQGYLDWNLPGHPLGG